MWKSAIGSAILLGLLLHSASSPPPLDAAGKPAPDRKRGNLFGPDKLWTIPLTLGPAEYAAMAPKGGPLGPGFSKNNEPLRKEKKQDAAAANIHKGKGFGLEFPWVKG